MSRIMRVESCFECDLKCGNAGCESCGHPKRTWDFSVLGCSYRVHKDCPLTEDDVADKMEEVVEEIEDVVSELNSSISALSELEDILPDLRDRSKEFRNLIMKIKSGV